MVGAQGSAEPRSIHPATPSLLALFPPFFLPRRESQVTSFFLPQYFRQQSPRPVCSRRRRTASIDGPIGHLSLKNELSRVPLALRAPTYPSRLFSWRPTFPQALHSTPSNPDLDGLRQAAEYGVHGAHSACVALVLLFLLSVWTLGVPHPASSASSVVCAAPAKIHTLGTLDALPVTLILKAAGVCQL